MLGASFAIAALQSAIAELEFREARIQACKTPEERMTLIRFYEAIDKSRRDERKRQELLQAIRDSCPRGFGIFW